MVSRKEKQKFCFDNKQTNKKAIGSLSTFRADDLVMMKFGDTWKRAEMVTPRP